MFLQLVATSGNVWTLTEAVLRGGLTDMADGLVAERLALRPHRPVNLGFHARLAAADVPA